MNYNLKFKMGEPGILWYEGMEPDKSGREYQILMNLLHDNHYSTVVDLEEDSIEIERFAI